MGAIVAFVAVVALLGWLIGRGVSNDYAEERDRVESAPAVNLSDLAPGVTFGVLEAEAAGEPRPAPLSGDPVVWWRIEELDRRRSCTGTGSDRRCRTTTTVVGTRWSSSEVQARAQGRIVSVAAADAELDRVAVTTVRPAPSGASYDSERQLGLAAGSPLTVVGLFSRRPSDGAPVVAPERDTTLLWGGTRDQVLGGLSDKAGIAATVGRVFLGIAIGLGLVAAGFIAWGLAVSRRGRREAARNDHLAGLE